MRGEKIRKPIEYIRSLDLLIALQPEVIVPSHLDPTVGAVEIRQGMERIRDAVQYVHDETVAGMNAGKSVYDLMQEIQLPPHLALVQNHGKVDWAVRSIWDYYATWFHFDSTTELYPVPVRAVYAELAEAAGSEALLSLATNHLARDEPVNLQFSVRPSLRVQPEQNYAETDEYVYAESDDNWVESTGMQAWLKKPMRIKLLAKVRGRYEVE